MGLDPVSMGLEAGGAVLSAVSRLFLARKQRKLSDAINPVRTPYEISPYAQQNKSMAQNYMNAARPGSAAAMQGIGSAQAAAIGAGNRNATNSGDALALAAGAQGTAQQGYVQNSTLDDENRLQGMGMVTNANNALTQENMNKWQDNQQEYLRQLNTKNALLGASLGNKYGAFSDIGNGMMMGGSAMSQAGGFGSMFGGNSGGSQPLNMGSYYNSIHGQAIPLLQPQ